MQMQLDQLRALYPNLSDEEITETAENLERYLKLAWEIYEHQRAVEREL